MAFNPRRLIPVAIIGALAVAGVVIDRVRDAKRSTLSGTFESQPAQLSSRVGGRVAEILVKEGDTVKAGQVLVHLEDQAREQDVKAAAAAAEEAEARQKLSHVGTREQDIRRQQAVVAELRAGLLKLENGSLPEEIGQADARAKEAYAKLQEVKAGARKEDVAAAKAAMDEADAQLAIVVRGPRPEEKSQIAARLASAKANRDQAQRDYNRIHRLFAQDAVTKSDDEAARTKLANAQADFDQANEANEASESGSAQEEVDQARSASLRAHNQYLALKNGSRPEDIAQAQQEYNAALANLALVKRGARSEDIAAAKARLAQGQATLDELQVGSRPEEKAQADAAANAAQSSAASTAATVAERDVKAPTDGVVERILVAVGDLLTPNAPLISFTNPSDIWLRVYLPQDQLAKVKVGDEATLIVDGVSDQLAGKVESIATQGEFTPVNLQTPDERGRQLFAVRIRLAKPDSRVHAGMFATAKKVGQWP